MRTIAGVRYEIKVRYVTQTADYIFARDVSIDLITKLMPYLRKLSDEIIVSHSLRIVGSGESSVEAKLRDMSRSA